MFPEKNVPIGDNIVKVLVSASKKAKLNMHHILAKKDYCPNGGVISYVPAGYNFNRLGPLLGGGSRSRKGSLG